MAIDKCNHNLANIIHGQAWSMDRLFAHHSKVWGVIFKTWKGGKMGAAKQKIFDKAMYDFQTDAEYRISQSIQKGVQLANLCNDDLAKDYYKKLSTGLSTDKLVEATGEGRKIAAAAFAQRVLKGELTLSERVWNLTEQTSQSIQHVLESGIFNGRSAPEMARDLKQYLKEPNRNFKRVRNADGKLVLSNPAKNYHSGQGVYRSSYKNALRLSRNEVNIAYRKADFDRRQNMDFVMGHKVQLSAQHPKYDICDELAGNYPKQFLFSGWHVQCMCFSTSILMPQSEYVKYLNGEPLNTAYQVKNIPPNASLYLSNNSHKIAAQKTAPHFIRDNFSKNKSGVYVPSKSLEKSVEQQAKQTVIKPLYSLPKVTATQTAAPVAESVKTAVNLNRLANKAARAARAHPPIPSNYQKLGLTDDFVEKLNANSFAHRGEMRDYVSDKFKDIEQHTLSRKIGEWLGDARHVRSLPDGNDTKEMFHWAVENVVTKDKKLWRGLQIGSRYSDEDFDNIIKQFQTQKKISFGKDNAFLGEKKYDLRLNSASSNEATAKTFARFDDPHVRSIYIEYQNDKGMRGLRLGDLYKNGNYDSSEFETIIGDTFDYEIVKVEYNKAHNNLYLVLKQLVTKTKKK